MQGHNALDNNHRLWLYVDSLLLSVTLDIRIGGLLNSLAILQLLDMLYRVTKVQPVDMFPWTEHIESVVLMSRAGVETTD